MSVAPSVPVALAVHLAGPPARRAFLLDHVSRLVPGVARAAAFSDLGGAALELLLDAPGAEAFTAWVAEIARSGHVLSIRAERDPARRSDGAHRDGEMRTRYRDAQYVLSARALRLLAMHPPELPRQVVTAELWRPHADAGRPHVSARWHVAWLRALGGEGPWPDSTDEHAVLAARLAHAQWLRLTGGHVEHRAEIAALEALLSSGSVPPSPGTHPPG